MFAIGDLTTYFRHLSIRGPSNSQKEGPTTNLPPDIICKIFGYVECKDLPNIFRVCKNFRNCDKVEVVWEALFRRDFVICGGAKWEKNPKVTFKDLYMDYKAATLPVCPLCKKTVTLETIAYDERMDKLQRRLFCGYAVLSVGGPIVFGAVTGGIATGPLGVIIGGFRMLPISLIIGICVPASVVEQSCMFRQRDHASQHIKVLKNIT